MTEMYASVIVPRPIERTFTYRVPEKMQAGAKPGYRVIVQFGNKRYVTGVIESVTFSRPENVCNIKEIEALLDASPIVTNVQIRLWKWIAEYYMCAVGDVMKAALPGGLKVESETVVTLNPEGSPEMIAQLSERDFAIVKILEKEEKISVKNLAKTLRESTIEPRISKLVEVGIVSVHEEMSSRYRRVKMQFVSLLISRGEPDALSKAFEMVKRSAGQQEALMHLISLSGFTKVTEGVKAVSRRELIEASEQIKWSDVQALAKKGLASISVREVSRFNNRDTLNAAAELPTLSEAQSNALQQIHQSFTNHQVTLLHGVTSSGKTEIYIHLIDFAMKQGKQVLYLVPEIALTTQLTRRLQHVFGEAVRIYHSKFSDNERIDIYRDMLSDGKPCVVVGARSSVFLPFTALGLVIVDEEHEASYKQYDPAPRYNGRDVGIMLSKFYGAKTLLGSATPSVETYYKATEGEKFGLVELKERYGKVNLPTIEVVDMLHERKRKAVRGILADLTVEAAKQTLGEGKQVIFFHNRRGYSPRAHCKGCDFTPRCDFCDVALTYHKSNNTLQCHYCGAIYPVPKVCPACGEPTMEVLGYGTERVEDGISEVFPDSKILRMDLDTTRNKEGYSRIIDDFSNHKADILVGTQMVTKGLDFGGVGLVAVLNADQMIHFPDFRSAERAFNMIEQVSGRAGRRSGSEGRVVIQTHMPGHSIIGFVKRHDYEGFYAHEIEDRRQHSYPPFCRIVNIYLKHKDRAALEKYATAYAQRLRTLPDIEVKGPIEPQVYRIASLYIRTIMVKIENGEPAARIKGLLRAVEREMQTSMLTTNAPIYYDVDPV